jgi:tetratricopeptide (TPR) repeat protein
MMTRYLLSALLLVALIAPMRMSSAQAISGEEQEYARLSRPLDDISRDRFRDAEMALRPLSSVDALKRDAKTVVALRAMALLGVSLTMQAKVSEAEEALLRCLSLQRELFGSDDLEVATTLYYLAKLHRLQGRYVDAIARLTEALHIRTAVMEPEDRGIAEILHQFGAIYGLRQKNGASHAMYLLAAELRERALRSDTTETAETLRAIAGIHVDRKEYQKAGELLTRALQIQEKGLGGSHSEVAVTLASLASVHNRLEQAESAENYARRSLAIRENIFGPDHPTVGLAYQVLGTVYHTRERYRESKPYYEKALRIREASLGPDHPGLAAILESLAAVHTNDGERDEALRLRARARALREKADPHLSLSLLKNPDLEIWVPEMAGRDMSHGAELRIHESSTRGNIAGHTAIFRDGRMFITTDDVLEKNPQLIFHMGRCPYGPLLLVLTGGGIKGAYQVGALWFMVNVLECDVAHIYGSSTGAVTASFLAQAANSKERKELVEQLIANYTQSRPSDIIKPRLLGKLRIFLPKWAGGIDGINTLDPLSRRLAKQIDPARIRNLTVVAVSLQGGPLPFTARDGPTLEADVEMRPDDPRDVIVGSASIPVVIEPKLARFWVQGNLLGYENDIITVESKISGIPDSKCEVRVSKTTFSCELIRSQRRPTNVRLPGQPRFKWISELRLSGMSASDRAWLTSLAEATRRTVEGSDWVEIRKQPVEFSTLHQLVDGGVTDFLPLRTEDQIDLLGSRDKTLMILTTGDYQDAVNPHVIISGGTNIGLTAFEYLWQQYQNGTMSLLGRNAIYLPLLAEAEKSLSAAIEWRKAAESRFGRGPLAELDSKFELRETEKLRSTLGELITGKHPRILLVTPQKRIFKDPFDANPELLREALHHGCSSAAELFRTSMATPSPIVSSPEQIGPQLLCDALLAK